MSSVPAFVSTARYRGSYAAHVIAEYFASGRQKLLVIYGEGHNYHNGGPMMSGLEAKIDLSKLFVIGTIADLDMAEKDRIARFGDTAKPFYLPAADFPVTRSLPNDFFYAENGMLKNYIDAVIYLGPEADRDLKNSIQLTPAQEAELERREAIKVDLKVKFGQKDKWFLNHPNDIPKRPLDN